MPKRVELAFAGFLLVLVLMFVIGAFSYEKDVRYGPLIVGIPTLALLVSMILILSVKIKDRGAKPEVERQAQEEQEPTRSIIGWKEITFILWFVAYVLAAYLVGLLTATPLFILSFFFFNLRENIAKSAIYGAMSWIVLYFVFKVGLSVHFEHGLLIESIIK